MAPSRKPLYFHFNPEAMKNHNVGQEIEGIPIYQVKQPHTYCIEYTPPIANNALYAGTITIGYAITHPKDAFLKSVGRAKAEGRIKHLATDCKKKPTTIVGGPEQVKIHPDAAKSLPTVINMAWKIYQLEGMLRVVMYSTKQVKAGKQQVTTHEPVEFHVMVGG
jgi:hypothetical protein